MERLGASPDSVGVEVGAAGPGKSRGTHKTSSSNPSCEEPTMRIVPLRSLFPTPPGVHRAKHLRARGQRHAGAQVEVPGPSRWIQSTIQRRATRRVTNSGPGPSPRRHSKTCCPVSSSCSTSANPHSDARATTSSSGIGSTRRGIASATNPGLPARMLAPNPARRSTSVPGRRRARRRRAGCGAPIPAAPTPPLAERPCPAPPAGAADPGIVRSRTLPHWYSDRTGANRRTSETFTFTDRRRGGRSSD